MGDAFETDWFTPLERHRSRRLQAVPTITVLAGAAGAPEWLWMCWHHANSTAIVKASQAEQVLEQWLGQGPVIERIHEALLDRIAGLEGVAREELTGLCAGRSTAQLEDWATHSAAQLDVDIDWVRRALRLPTLGPSYRFDRRSLAVLLALAGDPPPLLVRPAGSPEALVDVVHALYSFSESAPQADIALALDEGALHRLQSILPERIVSVLMEGLIKVRPRRPPGASRATAGNTIEYDPEQFARSRAELSLFELLQRRPRTRGLFRLNRVVHGSDGSGAMEIDLLCASLRIALEVDGYHHFRDAEAYRRDRRKDLRLQESGHLVVRVLASDIDRNPEHVLETIERAVENRRRSPS